MRAPLRSALGSRLDQRGALARRLEQARAQRGGDEGVTIVEMLVTLLILSAIIPVALLLITNIFQQSQNVHDTMLGVQQDQTAGQSLLQYLHATIVVLPGSNATTLNASILAGVNSSGTLIGTPHTATLNAVFTNSANPKFDATLTTSLTPDGSTRTSSIGTYDAINSSTVFTYYYNNVPNGLTSTTTPTSAQLAEIVAVNINVTFLAGPHKPVYGFHAVHASNFQTTVYLQNAAGAPAPTSSTAITPPTNPAVGSPATLTATVSPIPDGGNITWTISYGGSALSVCTAPVDVDVTNGTAPCTFTPTSGGTYSVTASFSGTSDFQPSTGTASIVVPLSTTTSISESTSKSGNQDTMTVTATVSPSAATGPVEFTLQVCTTGFFGSCKNYNGAVNLSGGTAIWTQSGLKTGGTYTVSAAYQGNSTYSGSTSQTLNGTLP
jgi:hypothetical protein